MRFTIDKAIFGNYPGLRLGAVIAKNISNVGNSGEFSDKFKSLQEEVRLKLNHGLLSQQPKIACWRRAYSSFGAKPKGHKSSVENLYSLILRGGTVRPINKLVDIYNFISIKHMLPVGGEDLGKVRGGIILTLARENEPPVLLLGDKEPRPPHKGEVIYKDDISAICRRWNWREADRTKLTEGTNNCFLVVEGLPPVGKTEIETATKEMSDLVEKYCGGFVRSAILDETLPGLTLD